MNTFLYGFSLGFSLILAIGAQNAFVLRQGLKNEHVFIVCLICALSDAVLILTGIGGFHVLVSNYPWVVSLARYGGALFLFIYGLLSFRKALSLQVGLHPSEIPAATLTSTVLTCLALTWLNPHVYLDTVVLMGSISAQFPGESVEFASGATIASFVFFFGLGYGAQLLRPLFARASAWQYLEVLIGLVMWLICARLVFM